MEVSDGLTLTLGGTTIGLIFKELLAWHRSRNQKTTLAPDPLNVSPSFAEQNRAEHAELYGMVRKHEAQIAGIIERDVAQEKILDRMAAQLDKLYDRIIGGKKK